jgi:DNA-binding MarR family transcriptional regulator
MERTLDVLAGSQQFRKILEKRCEKLNEDYDVRLVEMDILDFLARAGQNNTAKDIMSDLHISKAHISKSVENLRSKGYLVVLEDAQDHRCIHLSITEKAKPLIQAFADERNRFLESLMEGVTREEREILRRVAGTIMENLHREYLSH